MKKSILLLLIIANTLVSFAGTNNISTPVKNQVQVNSNILPEVDCPTAIIPVNTSLTVYANIAITLIAIQESTVPNSDIDNVEFIWYDDDGIEVPNPNAAVFSYDGSDIPICSIDTQMIELRIRCLEDTNFVVLAGYLTLYIAPDFGELFPPLGGCNYTFEPFCPELMAEYSIDGGDTFFPDIPNFTPNEDSIDYFPFTYKVYLEEFDIFNWVIEIDTFLFCSPASLKPEAINGNFGEIPIDENDFTTLTLDLINDGGMTLIISDLTLDSDVFSINVNSLEIDGGSQQQLSIFFDSPNIGTFSDTLYITSNDGNFAIPLSISTTEATGLSTIVDTAIKIYPNPNQGQFMLQSKNNIPFSYKIYNSLGQLIVKQKTADNNEVINLAEAGLYVVFVETNEGVWVEKVVVK